MNSFILGNNHKVIHGNCIEILKNNEISDIDLVIADPPYWKVVNEKWDYQWRTEDDYLKWSKQWLLEIYNKLRIGGSFYLFGYFRILALLIPILNELGFSLRQQIVVDKGMQAVAGRATKNYKMFPNVTESILFLVKDNKEFSRQLLKSRQKELKLTSKAINEALGVKSNGGGMWSIYTGKNICEQFPTRELWAKLEKVLQFSYPYDKIAQTYNPQMGLTDVWTDINFYSENRYHPTQKPLKLIKRIIQASSNIGDVVLDPFAGSGSTLLASEQTDRKSLSIELEERYINSIKQRFYNESINLLPL
ncbi:MULTISPECIES: DNA-methyltransferase [Akkermansia]|uniref:DNA-methyltransferase n=1 Tax=Akkermansia TaxID=239934 RepID=UPI0029E7CBEB|nr:site-specific DNA-methyltransferase [Akkermansia muciniphila]WPK65647.1 site-specific DNA-methyltransferase [Akkermansia muciniphila]